MQLMHMTVIQISSHLQFDIYIMIEKSKNKAKAIKAMKELREHITLNEILPNIFYRIIYLSN